MYNSSYYNPFLYQPYYQGASQLASAGLGRSLGTGLGVKGLLSRFNWSNFLTSTGKTLNVINQAIPIFYQVRPIVNNAKTMFRVLGAVKDTDKESPSQTSTSTTNNQINNSQTQNIRTSTQPTSQNNSSSNTSNPTFFL